VFEGEYDYSRPNGPEGVSTILDIGLNVGAFAVWACEFWWQGQITRYTGYDPNVMACAFARINTAGIPIAIVPLAVTTELRPRFHELTDWGSSRTHKQTLGERVPCCHPGYLPLADVLKCDAEGVELEVFEHWQGWAGVKVVMFEYHEASHREPLEARCSEAGLTQVRHHGSPPEQGVQVWVRR
jgi:hypothetical protein